MALLPGVLDPEYWTPRFLSGLADHLGFGIEDVLFVAGLGAFSSTAYAVAFRRTLAHHGASTKAWWRAAGAFALAMGVTGALLAVGAHKRDGGPVEGESGCRGAEEGR